MVDCRARGGGIHAPMVEEGIIRSDRRSFASSQSSRSPFTARAAWSAAHAAACASAAAAAQIPSCSPAAVGGERLLPIYLYRDTQ